MAFPTPSENDVSTDSENSDSENKTFDGRNEDMEDYKAVIDAESAIQALCMTHGVGVDGGFARYNDVKDESPLAEMGLFYYQKKQEMKTELRDSRESEDGELSEDQNLPAYMDQFGEPEYEYDEITAENAGDFGIDAEHISEDRTLYVPTELELPTDEDGNLKLWNDEDGESEFDHTKEDVLEVLSSVKGAGDTITGRQLNALQEAGIVPEDI